MFFSLSALHAKACYLVEAAGQVVQRGVEAQIRAPALLGELYDKPAEIYEGLGKAQLHAGRGGPEVVDVADVLAAEQHAGALRLRDGGEALEKQAVERGGVFRRGGIGLEPLAHVGDDLLGAVGAQAQKRAAGGEGLGHDALFLVRAGLGQGEGEVLLAAGAGLGAIALQRGALLLVGPGVKAVGLLVGGAQYGADKALELAFTFNLFHVSAS